MLAAVRFNSAALTRSIRRCRNQARLSSTPAASYSSAMGSTQPRTRELLQSVQKQLASVAAPSVAKGQDAYFKDVIKHRGVKTPAVEAVCKQLLKQQAAASPADLRELALALLREPLQEDKLAGTCVWRHCLLKGGLAADWRSELAALQELYTGGHVFVWSTCDGICGRLLGPLSKLLLRSNPAEEEACCRAIMAWCQHSNLWLRRSSVVAFVTLARLPDDKVFPGFRAALTNTLAVTVRGQERFSQTGTGWVLRELGKGDEQALLQFAETHLHHFNREGLRYALEQQTPAVRTLLLARHKALAAAGQEGGGVGQPQRQQAGSAAEGQVPGTGGSSGLDSADRAAPKRARQR